MLKLVEFRQVAVSAVIALAALYLLYLVSDVIFSHIFIVGGVALGVIGVFLITSLYRSTHRD